MGRHPIVSYGGDCSLFCSLQGSLVAALPEETVEWRRSYGRPSRYVNIEVDFVPFSEECLLKDPNRSVLQQPTFHTYWTDCTDIETYKSSVRDSVQAWVSELRSHAITDWMVVLVGAPDTKKANKLLPRTSVLDKMKSDFGGKQAERCVSLYEPVKTDSRSMESWQALLAKMRSLTMVAYNRALNRFEEQMRGERERRTDKSWSFCGYFSVQEELAEVMRLLGAQEEALVQYDELDALLTQFVLNSAAGDTPLWLSNFRQTCERWEGLYLSGGDSNKALQQKIQDKNVSLLELRNYLFQQQASLLVKLNKPWDLASRALSFLQNTVQELMILRISVATGGVACWGFLSCMEVIHTLSRYNTPAATQLHARNTAPLWAYARDKLQELGKLCGLEPGGEESSSEQLHTVIALVCGMGNDPHDVTDGAVAAKVPHQPATVTETTDASFGVAMLDQDLMTPMTRLKEALSSREAFKKHYLELSEVAISTHKHIGHVRSARLIGRDLASFYLRLGQPQQAANFLTDLLHSFNDGDWPLLAADTRHQLQACYRAMEDWPRVVRVSAELACCSALPLKRRVDAFDAMKDAAQDLVPHEVVSMAAHDVASVTAVTVTSPSPVTLGSTLHATAKLHSHLPADIVLDSVVVLLKLQYSEDLPVSSAAPGRKRSSDASRVERKVSGLGKHHHTPTVNRSNSGGSESSDGGRSDKRGTIAEEGTDEAKDGRLSMSLHLDYKQDNTLATAAVVCNNTHSALSRRDSHSRLSSVAEQLPHITEVTDVLLTATNVTLTPGDSSLQLTAKLEHKGVLVWRGAELRNDYLHLLQYQLPSGVSSVHTEVLQQSPRVVLGRKGRDLTAGLSQHMLLTVHAGTTAIDQDTSLELRSSRGLLLSTVMETVSEDDRQTLDTTGSGDKCEGGLVREVSMRLPRVEPLATVTVQLTVLALLGPQRDTNAVDHIVSLSSSLLSGRQDVDVHFTPPFCSVSKLHTANTQKFFQVKVSGLVAECVELRNAMLSLQPPATPQTTHLTLTPVNADHYSMVVNSEQSCSYMWELGQDYSQLTTLPLKLEFSAEYCTSDSTTNSTTASSTASSTADKTDKVSDAPRTYRCTFDLADYKTVFTIKSRVEPGKGTEFCRAGSMCHLQITVESPNQGNKEDCTEAAVKTSDGYDSVMYEVLADQTMWAVCGRTSGVLSVECARGRQVVTLDVMPLLSGFLPLPSVRLSKYIPADVKRPDSVVGSASSIPRLEPFAPGQVYNFSKGSQVHVLTAAVSATDGPAY